MAPRSVLITGCSAGGIGCGLAEAFQERGIHVFATGRTLSKMSNLEKLPNVTLIALDVTVPSTITAAVKAVEAHTGGTLDYLVNNSACGLFGPTLDVDIEDAKKVFDVNFWGALAVTQNFAPLLIAAKGTIVNISSITVQAYSPWISIYGASKAALGLLSETLRLELSPLGVKVVSVVTGAVESNGFSNLPELKLPPTSKYLPIEKVIVARSQGEDGVKRMDTKTYAARVVKDVLGGANGRIWRGKLATTVKWMTVLFPTFILDVVMKKDTGLDIFPKDTIGAKG